MSGREVVAPVYMGWDAFNAVERRLYQRGKTHATSVVIASLLALTLLMTCRSQRSEAPGER